MRTKTESSQRLRILRINNVIVAACATVGLATTEFARADIVLGSSWVANAQDGYDSFHKFDAAAILTATPRAGGDTWLRVDVPQQYYTGLATEIGNHPDLSIANIAANPVVQFDLDMTEWTWPGSYISVGYFSNDASNSNTYFSYAEPSTAGIIGNITHVVADLNTLHADGNSPASSRPDATYFNIVINVDPAYGTGGPYTANSQHFYIDNVKLTAPIVYGSAQWKSNTSGVWNTYDATNWDTAIPNGVDQAANFGTFGGTITSPTSVNVNAAVTVGTINFDNTNSYTLSGSPITLNTATTGDHAVLNAINVLSGSHTINNQVVKGANASPISFNVVQPSSTLTIPNLAGQYYTFQKDGAGKLIVNRAQNVTLFVNGGTVQMIPSGASNAVTAVYYMQIAAGAKLDLTNNGFLYDYTGTSPQDDVRNMLATGYAGGSWNGNSITSSTAAAAASGAHKTGIGYADTADPGVADAITNFTDQTIDGTSILLRYTLMGDSNLDGTVDSGDFNQLANAFNSSGQHWFTGDFNYDGIVNALDFNAIASNFGSSLAAPALGSVVPEPATIAAMMLAPLFFVRRRSR
jgi:hypothetical protein